MAFKDYGLVQLQWPGKNVKSSTTKGDLDKAGYVYCIFETQEKVKQLLDDSEFKYDQRTGEAKWFCRISSKEKTNKRCEIKPWNVKDGSFINQKVDNNLKCKTLFVGALHGMITAKGLSKVIDELFGDVVSVDIDTDKNRYPGGSARVTVLTERSYFDAINAEFVQIRCPNFTKKVNIRYPSLLSVSFDLLFVFNFLQKSS